MTLALESQCRNSRKRSGKQPLWGGLLLAASIMAIVAPLFCSAQDATTLSPEARKFVRVADPAVALTHVRVIDGTGTAPLEDQTVVIERGRITALGSSAKNSVPAGAKVIDLRDFTLIPGLVGMHEHMFYPSGGPMAESGGALWYNELGFSAPRLYLACGLTSIRTAGSMEPYADLTLKKWIDEGRMVGPKMHVTGPYLENSTSYPQMHDLTGPEDARKTVEYWADEGVTSFKGYRHITRSQLASAIEAAHKRGLKVTGHLCAVGFSEAAELGIDDLEHGLLVDTEFVPGKKPDVCPSYQEADTALSKLDVMSTPVQEMIRDLVTHHVAVTSTLSVFESSLPNRPPLSQRVLDAMLPEARIEYLGERAHIAESADSGGLRTQLFKKEMQFERAFVKAGGLLLAGEDPTGNGGSLPGFGDQRELELLVEAGFTPVEAIQIYSANGAAWLGESDRIGTLAPGKQADLVVIRGNPAAHIGDIENVEMVFKDGIGYDSARLIQSVSGSVGLH
jgi:imidazolonepropionase-like amidohydrolase